MDPDRSAARTPVPARPSPLRGLQDRLARVFGVGPTDRTATVREMLDRTSPAAAYWLQLLVAMAIATLGLLLGSTAAVIGAMLVSPLMTPLIELGMGLAIGSPLLVTRAGIRIGTSTGIVVLSASALTLLVPFHEVTTEIAGRTAPTLLDLAIASFCAVAGVYAAMRPAGAATTAAGTAIGIALVPPLCVVGFGVGIQDLSIAGGAALLFTANICAILLFSVIGFLLLGYGHVDVPGLERQHAEDASDASFVMRVARRMSVFFASRLGRIVRFAMPVLLVAVVYVPLRRALEEVTWELRTRAATQDALRNIPQPSVQATVRVDRHRVFVRIVAIVNEVEAAKLRAMLAERIERASGVAPVIDVVAVADSAALARAQDALRDKPAPAPPVTLEPAIPRLRAAGDQAFTSWPSERAGRLVDWRLSVLRSGASAVETLHLGDAITREDEALLVARLASELRAPIRIIDVPLSTSPLRADGDDGGVWVARVASAIALLKAFPEARISACIDAPARVLTSLRSSTPFGDGRIVAREDATTIFRWSEDGCETPDAGAADASGADPPSPVDP